MYQTKKHAFNLFKRATIIIFDVLFLLSLAFLATVAAQAQSSTSNLSLTVKTDKQNYTYNEPVNITLEAENLTGSDKLLSFSSGCQMGFEIYQYIQNSKAYNLPVFNNDLFPRNCSQTPTSITIPNGKKAIWTRSLDSGDLNYPKLIPGEYMLHAYITDYQDENWSLQNATYLKFSINYSLEKEGEKCSETSLCGDNTYCGYKGVFAEDGTGICLPSSMITAGFPLSQICMGSGGSYNNEGKTCICASDYSWSEKAGCTKSVFLDELCINTGGMVTGNSEQRCFCSEQKQWDIINGCEDVNTVEFNDITGHWAEQFIRNLALKGVVSGYEDGGFRPDSNVNRAELVKMALSASGIPAVEPQADVNFKFNDVSGWQTQWVYPAWEKGIVKGYNEYNFAPAKDVTRAEALKIIMLAFNVEVPDTSTEWAFPDTIGHWAISYINKAYLDFIVSGRADNKFYPDDPITRAEVSKIIQLLSEK